MNSYDVLMMGHSCERESSLHCFPSLLMFSLSLASKIRETRPQNRKVYVKPPYLSQNEWMNEWKKRKFKSWSQDNKRVLESGVFGMFFSIRFERLPYDERLIALHTMKHDVFSSSFFSPLNEGGWTVCIARLGFIKRSIESSLWCKGYVHHVHLFITCPKLRSLFSRLSSGEKRVQQEFLSRPSFADLSE